MKTLVGLLLIIGFITFLLQTSSPISLVMVFIQPFLPLIAWSSFSLFSNYFYQTQKGGNLR